MMERPIFCSFVILTLLSLKTSGQTTVSPTNSCSDAVLGNCTSRLNSVQQFFPPGMLPAICNTLSSAVNCTTSNGCPSTTAPVTSPGASNWASMYTLFSDICSTSGQAAYTQYQPCLLSSSLSSVFSSCLQNIASNDTCVQTNSQIACSSYTIQQTCSPASLVAGATAMRQRHLMEYYVPFAAYFMPGCTIVVPPNTTTVTITSGASSKGPVDLWLVVIVAIAVLLYI